MDLKKAKIAIFSEGNKSLIVNKVGISNHGTNRPYMKTISSVSSGDDVYFLLSRLLNTDFNFNAGKNITIWWLMLP
jgi:hypothetical protein